MCARGSPKVAMCADLPQKFLIVEPVNVDVGLTAHLEFTTAHLECFVVDLDAGYEALCVATYACRADDPSNECPGIYRRDFRHCNLPRGRCLLRNLV